MGFLTFGRLAGDASTSLQPWTRFLLAPIVKMSTSLVTLPTERFKSCSCLRLVAWRLTFRPVEFVCTWDIRVVADEDSTTAVLVSFDLFAFAAGLLAMGGAEAFLVLDFVLVKTGDVAVCSFPTLATSEGIFSSIALFFLALVGLFSLVMLVLAAALPRVLFSAEAGLLGCATFTATVVGGFFFRGAMILQSVRRVGSVGKSMVYPYHGTRFKISVAKVQHKIKIIWIWSFRNIYI